VSCSSPGARTSHPPRLPWLAWLEAANAAGPDPCWDKSQGSFEHGGTLSVVTEMKAFTEKLLFRPGGEARSPVAGSSAPALPPNDAYQELLQLKRLWSPMQLTPEEFHLELGFPGVLTLVIPETVRQLEKAQALQKNKLAEPSKR